MSEVRLTDEQRDLVEKNLSVVGVVVHRMYPIIASNGLEAEDAYSIGYLSLICAARAYKPEGRASFKTYSYSVIRNRLLSHIKNRNCYKRAGLRADVSLDQDVSAFGEHVLPLSETIADMSPMGIDPAIRCEQIEMVRIALETLSAYEKDILWKNLVARITQREIGRLCGRSGSIVGHDISCAIEKIRKRLEKYEIS